MAITYLTIFAFLASLTTLIKDCKELDNSWQKILSYSFSCIVCFLTIIPIFYFIYFELFHFKYQMVEILIYKTKEKLQNKNVNENYRLYKPLYLDFKNHIKLYVPRYNKFDEKTLNTYNNNLKEIYSKMYCGVEGNITKLNNRICNFIKGDDCLIDYFKLDIKIQLKNLNIYLGWCDKIKEFNTFSETYKLNPDEYLLLKHKFCSDNILDEFEKYHKILNYMINKYDLSDKDYVTIDEFKDKLLYDIYSSINIKNHIFIKENKKIYISKLINKKFVFTKQNIYGNLDINDLPIIYTDFSNKINDFINNKDLETIKDSKICLEFNNIKLSHMIDKIDLIMILHIC